MRKVAIAFLLLPVLVVGCYNLAERLHALQALPDGTGAWFGDWMGRESSAAGAQPIPPCLPSWTATALAVDLPIRQQSAVDSALNAPCSFHTGGLGVTVVIVPKTQRAYVFYAG